MRCIGQTAFFCLVSLVSAPAAQITWTNLAGGDWNSANNWSPGQVPGATDDAVIAVPVDVTMGGANSALSLALSGGARLIALGVNNSTQISGLWIGSGVTLNASNVTVAAGSAITADGQGYVTGAGPGGAPDPGDYVVGGTYGGSGTGNNSPAYGNYAAPTDLGSAGGGMYGGYSLGGGAIALHLTGTLALQGTISANGQSAGGNNSGGAGGSVYITTRSLTGSGAITANGDQGSNAEGGGGRVAVYYADGSGYTAFTNCTVTGYQPGTICFFDTSVPNSKLSLYGNMLFAQDSSLHYGAMALANGATVSLGGGSTLQVDGALSLSGNSTLFAGAKNNSAQVSNQWVGAGVTLYASDVTVEAGSAISADGKGYTTGAGPGAASSPGNYTSGGNYAGRGTANSGPTYGSYAAPIDLGSAGGGMYGGYSLGGGAIALHVAGSLVVQGTISANGQSSGGNNGGAAGGSVYITTATLVGSGAITADGDQGSNAQGGGGRVAVYYTDASGYTAFTNCTANGYQPGTVGFFDTTVPNSKLSVFASMDFAPDTWVHYGTMMMANGATLSLEGGVVLQVDGSLSLSGSSTVFAGTKNNFAQVNGHWAGVGVTLSASNLTVGAGSSLIADGRGYTTAAGPGAPTGGNDPFAGGSYGGMGSGSSGPTYGDAAAPLDLGSAGGGMYGGYSAGGGAIAVHVAGSMDLEGTISANGEGTGGNSGGGAGGSVFITTGTMAGSGAIAAIGGSGSLGGQGGGGRVAICCRQSLTFVTNNISVSAGGPDSQPGSLVIHAQAGACAAGVPLLYITPLNGKALLHWDDPAFGLQAAPTMTGSYTNVPSGTSPYTNPISGKGQFFRLISD